MRKFACLLIVVGLGVVASAQHNDVPRLRISTTAVEIDSVVTDKQGRHVDNLRAEDFELYQDGRRQTINSVRYVALGGAPAAAGAPSDASRAAANAPRPEDTRRTIAIVVDDLSMSFTNMAATRRALQTFVEREIVHGDLVAVIHAGHDGVISEPFTGDKRVLQETIGRLRYNLMSTANPNNAAFGGDSTRVERIDALQTEAFTVGALGAVNALVRAMRDLPGRKAVVLATDGFRLTEQPLGTMPSLNTRIIEAVKRLVDDANRSFVVMHAIDTRRLTAPDWATTDWGAQVTSTSFELTSEVLSGMLASREDGPEFLARAGGGLYLRRSNDLAGLFARVLEDQRGYYLLTYEPDEQTFQREDRRRPKFHSVKVKVTRPGVRVRARSGFFGVTDEDLKAPGGRGPASARKGFVPEGDLRGGQQTPAELVH